MYGNCCTVDSERRFLTREEKIEMLKDYKEALEKESKAVGEKIEDLEKAEKKK